MSSRSVTILRAIVPELSHSLHKGSCGRIAVVGGSEDYTGAPFLAAMGALRCGADMATIVCPPCAAPSIKAYSPDVIVRPLLVLSNAASGEGWIGGGDANMNRIVELLATRSHTCVIGPGLGTEEATSQFVMALIERLKIVASPSLRIVLDACAITALCSHVDSLRLGGSGFALGEQFVLTPNAVEFQRLCKSAQIEARQGGDDGDIKSDEVMAVKLAHFFRCTVVRKGATDIIAGNLGDANGAGDDISAVKQDEERGSCRRAAGQGDVFCGVLATMLAWGSMKAPDPVPAASCAFAASVVMKTCARLTEAARGPTFIASDMLPSLGEARLRCASRL